MAIEVSAIDGFPCVLVFPLWCVCGGAVGAGIGVWQGNPVYVPNMEGLWGRAEGRALPHPENAYLLEALGSGSEK